MEDKLLNKKTNRKNNNSDGIDNDNDIIHSNIKSIPKCEVCNETPFKYNCPSCHIKTCSVKCVNVHKAKANCTGEKDKFNKTKKLKNYSEKEFHRDIKFINDTINSANVAKKKIHHISEKKELENQDEHENENEDEMRSKNSMNFQTSPEKMQKNMKRLAKKFRGINLKRAPTIMDRFYENKSHYDPSEKAFHWTIKFIFMGIPFHIEENKTHCMNIEYLCPHTFNDTSYTLKNILNHFKENKEDISISPKLLEYVTKNENWDKDIKFLYKTNVDGILDRRKFLKIVNYYYEVCDMDIPLKDVLKGKDIFEYPEFYIYHPLP
jgi:hypothetical protein